MPKEYYLYVNGQRVKVSEQIYKVYWRDHRLDVTRRLKCVEIKWFLTLKLIR